MEPQAAMSSGATTRNKARDNFMKWLVGDFPWLYGYPYIRIHAINHFVLRVNVTRRTSITVCPGISSARKVSRPRLAGSLSVPRDRL